MDNTTSIFIARMKSKYKRDNSFVCRFIPFVRTDDPIKLPSVGIFMPNSNILQAMHRAQGFTLIELVVTMAVAIILVAIAVPNFRTSVQNNRMAAQINDLTADLSYARSEAIKRRANVSVCVTTDGANCSIGSWWSGRLVVDSSVIPVVLRARGPLADPADTLTPTPVTSTITFDSRGTAGAVTTFVFCDSRGASQRKVLILNSIGQVTVDRTGAPGTCP